MLYDKSFYELSESMHNNTGVLESTIEPDLEVKLKRLLNILFKRILVELQKAKENRGYIKFNIMFNFFVNPEEGYSEIIELMGNPIFHYFMGEHGIYIGHYNTTCNDWTSAYCEVIWNYQKYYEACKAKKPEANMNLEGFSNSQTEPSSDPTGMLLIPRIDS